MPEQDQQQDDAGRHGQLVYNAQVEHQEIEHAVLGLKLRTRAAAARAAVAAEAAAGVVITNREVPFLVNPALQVWAVVSTWRRYGGSTALALNRLQKAQLDLAAWRWQQQSADAAGHLAPEEVEELRANVIRLKAKAGPGAVATP